NSTSPVVVACSSAKASPSGGAIVTASLRKFPTRVPNCKRYSSAFASAFSSSEIPALILDKNPSPALIVSLELDASDVFPSSSFFSVLSEGCADDEDEEAATFGVPVSDSARVRDTTLLAILLNCWLTWLYSCFVVSRYDSPYIEPQQTPVSFLRG